MFLVKVLGQRSEVVGEEREYFPSFVADDVDEASLEPLERGETSGRNKRTSISTSDMTASCVVM